MSRKMNPINALYGSAAERRKNVFIILYIGSRKRTAVSRKM
jgi:hypothetical protein